MFLQDQTAPRIAALSRNTPVVLPIAALEQHGQHMPLFTDSLLCGEIVRRAAERLGDQVLVAPVFWLGNSHHHMDFCGTMSAEPRVYLDLLSGLLENWISHGFKRLVLLNGHGGNIVPGSQAVFEARQRHRERTDLLLLSMTYWLGAKPWEADPAIVQRRMGHACEWETSMMLRLAPRLVGDYANAPPVPFGDAFEPADRGGAMKDRTVPGHIGEPGVASAAKGETLFRAFTDGVVGILERAVVWDGRSWEG